MAATQAIIQATSPLVNQKTKKTSPVVRTMPKPACTVRACRVGRRNWWRIAFPCWAKISEKNLEFTNRKGTVGSNNELAQRNSPDSKLN